MKTLLILIGTFLLFQIHLFAQIERGSIFVITAEQNPSAEKEKQDTLPGIRSTNIPSNNPPNERVSFLYEKDDVIYYRYLKDTTKIGTMPKENFLKVTEPIYKKLKGIKSGSYSIPFRFRDLGGEKFDFESSLSLNTNIIFGFGREKKKNPFFELAIGLGVTGVNLIPDNNRANFEQSAVAFTPSIGISYLSSSQINIGAFFGMDILGFEDNKAGWHYNGQIWLGLGINVRFSEWDPNQQKG